MKRIVVAVVSLGAVTELLCACLYYSLAKAGATWKSANFSNDRFLVLLFPREDNTSCRRAVLASVSECNQESLEIYVDAAAVTMPRTAFMLMPPQDYSTYVKRLNQELDLWGKETDWSQIQYTMAPSEEGVRATVTVKDKRGTTREYAYLIREDSVQPVDVTTDVNVARNMAQ